MSQAQTNTLNADLLLRSIMSRVWPITRRPSWAPAAPCAGPAAPARLAVCRHSAQIPAGSRHGGIRMGLGGFDIFMIIVVVLAIVTVYLGVKTVPQGYNWTVERFGRYTRMLQP